MTKKRKKARDTRGTCGTRGTLFFVPKLSTCFGITFLDCHINLIYMLFIMGYVVLGAIVIIG
jgi:hypothetical protein